MPSSGVTNVTLEASSLGDQRLGRSIREGSRELGVNSHLRPALTACLSGHLSCAHRALRIHFSAREAAPVPQRVRDRARDASSSILLRVLGSLHNSLNRERSGGPVCPHERCSLKIPSQGHGKNDLLLVAPNVWKYLSQWMQVTS